MSGEQQLVDTIDQALAALRRALTTARKEVRMILRFGPQASTDEPPPTEQN